MTTLQYVMVFLLAVLLDIAIVWGRPLFLKLRQIKKESNEPLLIWLHTLLMHTISNKIVKPLLRFLRSHFWKNKRNRQRWGIIVELTLLAIWSIWVGKPYLVFDPKVLPAGHEFMSAIQTNHLWTQFKECGWCAVWNGFEYGGYPAFVDVHGSMLHPIVMVTTLIWGVVNGSKVALVISFWFAGLAQWWLSHELKVGWLPRIWSSGMVIVGGHLAGRMELGAFGVVLSTAMCSLVFAAVLTIARGGGRRAIVLLAITTASAILSGQGYMQVGLPAILPAMVFLVLDEKYKITGLWKNYLVALGLAVLLAAVFLVPVVHFLPNYTKFTDSEFASSQSLANLPLNLLIDDWAYYTSHVMGKLPYPYLYILYIGWIPVILAIIGLARVKRKHHRLIWFLATGIAFEFLIGSAVLLKWMVKLFPVISGIRHPQQIAGLAIPLILGLSAYGLERLLQLDWPKTWFSWSGRTVASQRRFSLKWLMVIPLFFSLQSGYQFTRHWIRVERQGDGVTQVLDALKTESLQWVEPPYGEHAFIEPAIRMGMKLSPGLMAAWRWKDREYPEPVLIANRDGPPSGPVEQVGIADGVPIYARYDQPYAAVSGGETDCPAAGSGGSIYVVCTTQTPGRLVVKENMYSGWKAWVDSERTPLLGDHWLEVDAPVGAHVYEFRYQPWDVPVGIILSFIGVLLCIWIWVLPPEVDFLSFDS